jgi:hypothetical protein
LGSNPAHEPARQMHASRELAAVRPKVLEYWGHTVQSVGLDELDAAL